MRTDVIMPQMGESVAEGTVTKWLKKVGDRVERDEPLFEISTDKVDAEIPSPVAGWLVEILVGEGTTVEINTRVAHISTIREDVAAAPAASAPVAATAPVAVAAAPAVAASPTPAPAAPAPVSARPAFDAEAARRAEEDLRTRRMAGNIPEAAELRRTRSSPLVRRIAREHNVALGEVAGSGLDGRVTKQDILTFIDTRPAAPVAPAPRPATPPAPVAPAPAPRPASPAAGRPAGGYASFPHAEVPDSYLWKVGDGDQVEPMSVMRKKIAEHMVISKRLSAHVNNFLEIDMTRLVRLRTAKKDEFLAKTGEKLTYMPFIIAAATQALKEFPSINASIVGEDVIYHRSVNMGVAVALDWGLLVPVIKRAEEKNILGLTRSMNDLANRARTKKLMPDEVAGATFSITNPGAFGSLIGTPIIPQPTVAILGVGAITKRPWVIEGPEGDSIAIRHIMMTSLSFDHRLVDGAEAAKFMVRMRDILENDFDASSL